MSINTSVDIADLQPFQPVGRVHLGYLDGLRALAAIYVMFYHTWLTVYWNGRQPDHLTSLWGGWLGYGHFAVDLFIVLSGFCLMIPIARGEGSLNGGAVTFYKRRARRILPPYYAALVISIAFATTVLRHKMGTVWDYSLPVTPMGIAAHLLLLQNVHRAMEINSVFWSIAVECQIYLLFPLLIILWKKAGWQVATAAIIAAGLIAGSLTQHTRLQGLTAHYLALFALGMLGAAISFSPLRVLAHCRENTPWRAISLVLFAIVIFLCARFTGIAAKDMIFIDVLVGLCAASLLVSLAHDTQSRLHRTLSWKPLVFVGTFSYSLYLIHLPLVEILWQYGVCPLHLTDTVKLFLLCIAGGTVITLLAYLFFLAFERPFLSRRRNETMIELAKDAALSPAP